MELRQYARTLWKWLWLIVLGALLAGVVTYIISSRSTPIYRASTQILIRQASNPNNQQWLDVLTSERLAKNYARLLTTRPILERVAQENSLPEVRSKIVVDPVRETQIIVLHVEDPNPALAAKIAADLPRVFIAQNEEQQRARFDESLKGLNEQVASVEGDIASIQEKLEALQDLENRGEELDVQQRAERASLETSLAQYRGSLADMLRTRDQVQREAALTVDDVVVVEPPVVPTSPARPRILVNTLIAVAMGFLLMVALAFLIEYLDDTVKLPEDASRITGLPALGSLVQHHGSNGQRQLITIANPQSPFSEGYRTLRTNIQFSSPDKPITTLMVTSASPAEGKSTTAANLAVVMAQSGKRTILVDTDLRRPVLHRMFEVPNSMGVTSALLRPAGSDLQPLLQESTIENLRLLTSGPQPPNPSELLGSNRMAELVAELKEHAAVLVFDSPPVLAVTDAAVVARWVDGVLLVLESAKTREAAAKRAVQELAKVDANVLGIAVNRLSSRLAGSNYYFTDYYEDQDEDTGGGGARRRWRGQGGQTTAQEANRPSPAGGLIRSQIPESRSSAQDA